MAAHPDDETLGCGATLALHAERGDSIHALFMTDGVSSRGANDEKEAEIRHTAALAALDTLGIKQFEFLRFADNELDKYPILKIIKNIENTISQIKPDIIYTHYPHDLNIDHQIVARATLTAARPLPGVCVKKILFYEVVSSTEWGIDDGNRFVPNYYVNVSESFDRKLEAIKFYEVENRPFPHPRSLEVLTALATKRGSEVGVNKAEGFRLFRELKCF